MWKYFNLESIIYINNNIKSRNDDFILAFRLFINLYACYKNKLFYFLPSQIKFYGNFLVSQEFILKSILFNI